MNLSKTLSRRTILMIALAGIAISLVLVLLFLLIRPIQSKTATLGANTPLPYRQQGIKQERVDYGLPVHLKIPKIKVDAAVESLGLTSRGEMASPKGPSDTGWFKLGPRPGEIGSSIIVGHYGYKDHIPAIFDSLHELQKGDDLYVEDEKGTTITFVVRENRSYDPQADASSIFNSSDGKAHLILITCEGTWNASQKSYSNRLVVFADIKNS